MKIKHNIDISVILPVYNGERFLEIAVNSILQQSFKNFEFIIIDDGSSDKTSVILNYLKRSDSRIEVISRENRGLVFSLNEAVSIANGRYIARMDADDIAMPQRFGRQFDFLENHPDHVCVGSDVELIDSSGRKLTVWKQLADDHSIQTEALRGHTTICHPSVMMRTQAIRTVGGYHAEMYPAEDLDLWLKLGEVGKLANINEVLLRYRIHSNSISALTASDGKQREAAKRCSEAAWVRRRLEGVRFEATQPWRSSGSEDDQYDFDLKFGWWAYNSKEYATARSYGWAAWRRRPRSKSALALWGKSSYNLLRSKV